MNILIDIGHPAHVHYYRNMAKELISKGHKVVWTVKDIAIAKRLLDYYGFKYIVFPKKTDGLVGKVVKQLQYDIKLLNICRKEKIDLAIGTSVSVAHASKISKVKSIVFDDDDDEVQPLVTRYVNPYADVLLSPESLKGKRKRKDTIYYPGYHELAYLHPNRFTPDPSVLKEIGIKDGERFFIMRFNVFKAHHDIGIQGLSLEQKLKLVELLKPHGKIFITTEREIEPELMEFRLPVAPEKMHSLMAFCSIFLGDSQTMTTEAAILGSPAVKLNSFAGRLSVPNEIENKYRLCFSFLPSDFQKFIQKVNELLLNQNLQVNWYLKQKKMLSEKIDVTAFWVWFIENYPNSISEIKTNPNIFDVFK